MNDLLRATDLYLLAECPHRIHLEHRAGQTQAAAPTPGQQLLFAHGLRFEAEISAELGWPRPDAAHLDETSEHRHELEAAAEATLALMKQGVPGICQGVLRTGRFLAIPDLLERVPGASRLGTFHYRPGDIKTALEARADHALQVAFAAHLLEDIQGTRPASAFLILGDRRRENLALDELTPLLHAAVTQVEHILDGREQTTPFLCRACESCPWRIHCTEELEARSDLSLVDGMTPTRRRVLAREGITRIEELAAVQPAAWRRAGHPPMSLDQLVPQAHALLEGKIIAPQRPFEIPDGSNEALLVHAERDPLARGAVSLLACSDPGGTRVDILLDDASRRRAMQALLARVRQGTGPVLHFGGAVARTLGLLGEAAEISPRDQALLDARLWNLLLTLRRSLAYLPVRGYTLDEVIRAIVLDTPARTFQASSRNLTAIAPPDTVPGPAHHLADNAPPGTEALFVILERLRAEPAGPARAQVEAEGRRRLAQLAQLLSWITSHPTRAPRRAL